MTPALGMYGGPYWSPVEGAKQSGTMDRCPPGEPGPADKDPHQLRASLLAMSQAGRQAHRSPAPPCNWSSPEEFHPQHIHPYIQSCSPSCLLLLSPTDLILILPPAFSGSDIFQLQVNAPSRQRTYNYLAASLAPVLVRALYYYRASQTIGIPTKEPNHCWLHATLSVPSFH